MDEGFTFYSYTKTLCSQCGKKIDGKIIYNQDGAYIKKNCPSCGVHLELLEEDADFHLLKANYDKPGTISTVQTGIQEGCPYDCGLCPEHEQHSCINIIEITDRCNLNCDMCFAKSGINFDNSRDLLLTQIEKMMDFVMASENNKAEILQISGGEPTLHADILPILKMAKKKGFLYVMLNTNGIRIAEDDEFVRELSELKGGFEVYLQFDGLDDDVYETLRHQKLWKIKKKAIGNLSQYHVPTTLVTTVKKNVNDRYLGQIFTYGQNLNCVRGINFQPIAYYGKDEPEKDRITLTGVLNLLEKQTGKMIRKTDFIPLPCNADRVALTYLFRSKNGFIPITRNMDLSPFKDFIKNTFMFTIEDTIKNFKEDSRIFNVCSCCDLTHEIKKFLPKNFMFKTKEEKMQFVDDNTFRISISSFVDRFNFDIKSMQKECVHIITPDFKRIPFSAYNMIHREKYNGRS